MAEEFVELYVSKAIEEELEERSKPVIGVNRRLYKNQLLFIISKLHWKQIHYPNDYATYGVRIRTHANAKVLKENPQMAIGTLVWYFGSKGGKVSNQLHTLEHWGIIKRCGEPVIGVSARTFKLHERFDNVGAVKRKFTVKDGVFVKRLLGEQSERMKHPLVQTVLHMYSVVSLSEEGLQFLEQQYSEFPIVKVVADAHRTGLFDDNKSELVKQLRDVSLDVKQEHKRLWMFFQKEYYASIGNRNGRLDHNLTNLDSEFRKFILLDGYRMHETDITNSQPTFSIPVILEALRELKGKDYRPSKDMMHYVEVCRQGIFYEEIAKKANIDVSDREKRNHFKKNNLYPEVFYCRNNNWKTPTQVAFKALFPSAYEAIWHLKKENHNNFSIQLQKMESDLVVKTVYQNLANHGFKVLPLHDAIYTNSVTVKRFAENLLRSEFLRKHGLEISFKSGIAGPEAPDTAYLAGINAEAA